MHNIWGLVHTHPGPNCPCSHIKPEWPSHASALVGVFCKQLMNFSKLFPSAVVFLGALRTLQLVRNCGSTFPTPTSSLLNHPRQTRFAGSSWVYQGGELLCTWVLCWYQLGVLHCVCRYHCAVHMLCHIDGPLCTFIFLSVPVIYSDVCHIDMTVQ